jgi:hypothetical protein
MRFQLANVRLITLSSALSDGVKYWCCFFYFFGSFGIGGASKQTMKSLRASIFL